MGGGENDAAFGEMGLHQLRKLRERGLIEGRCGFIEQPHGPLGQEKPGQGQAAALPGGEQLHRIIGEAREIEGGQRFRDVGAAQHGRPEFKIFAHAEGGLRGIEMAGIMTVQGKRALRRRGQRHIARRKGIAETLPRRMARSTRAANRACSRYDYTLPIGAHRTISAEDHGDGASTWIILDAHSRLLGCFRRKQFDHPTSYRTSSLVPCPATILDR